MADKRAGKGKVSVSNEELAITCSADATLREIFTALEQSGLRLGIYPAASDKLTVGEWIDDGLLSNIGSYGFGTLDRQVRSIKTVLADGSAIETGCKGISNFSTGYNLNALFTGARGSLGKTVEVILKLYPKSPVTKPVRFGFRSTKDLFDSLKRVVKNPVTPYNISFAIAMENGAVLSASLDVIFEGTPETISADYKAIEGLLVNYTAKDEIAGTGGREETLTETTLERLGASGAGFLGDWVLPVQSANDFIEDVKNLGGVSRLFIVCTVTDRSTAVMSISAMPKPGEKIKDDEIEETLVSLVTARNGYSIMWHALGGLEAFESRMEKFHGRGGLHFAAAIKGALDPEGKLGKNELLAGYRSQTGAESRAPPEKGFLAKMREQPSGAAKKELANLVGDTRVSFEELELLLYNHDLAPLPNEIEFVFRRTPAAVVRPKTAEDIIVLMKYAGRREIPVVPRGGASWGFGGAVPTQGGIVVDMTSMNRIIEIDETGMTATCQPGVTWEQLIDEAGWKGLSIGAYPGSSPVATIGGWLSTGGSGIASYKYGIASDQVKSVQAVLSDGSVLITAPKSTAAVGYYNFSSLFAGAEGTTGIITEVTLKLHPKKDEIRPLSYSFASLSGLGKAFEELVRSPAEPYHVSFLDGNHFRYLEALGHESGHSKIPPEGAVANVVLEGSKIENDWAESVVDRIMSGHKGAKESAEFAAHEWEERAYELRARRLGPGGVLGEVVVPVGSFGRMCAESAKIIKQLRMESSINGVLVDRNTVVFMPYFISDERNLVKSMSSMGYVKKLIDAGTRLGGRPSGMGIWFAGNLEKLRGRSGARLVKRLKLALDPHDIINPGKYTEIRTRYGVSVPAFLMDVMLNVMGMVKSRLSKDEIHVPAETGHH